MSVLILLVRICKKEAVRSWNYSLEVILTVPFCSFSRCFGCGCWIQWYTQCCSISCHYICCTTATQCLTARRPATCISVTLSLAWVPFTMSVWPMLPTASIHLHVIYFQYTVITVCLKAGLESYTWTSVSVAYSCTYPSTAFHLLLKYCKHRNFSILKLYRFFFQLSSILNNSVYNF